jgi:opacity protein-like surface antigen
MKKTALITLLLSLIVVTGAFAAGAMTFGVDGGVAMPMGTFGDYFKMGFMGGAFGEYGINEQFAIGVGADYVKVGVKDEYKSLLEAEASDLAGEAVTVDVTESLIPITAYVKWTPPMKDSKVSPYVEVGGGYYMMKGEIKASVAGASINASDTTNKPGFFGGAGVDYKASPQVKVGVFAKYHDILTEGDSAQLFTAGVSVGFGLATK